MLAIPDPGSPHDTNSVVPLDSVANEMAWGDFLINNITSIGLGICALILLTALLISWRRGKVDSWLVVVTWIGVLGFSAEGMWVVATEKARVPQVVAAGVFFVAEALMVRSMRASSKRYKATTVRDNAGKVVKAGDPGKHGRAVWLIAFVAGVIVAFSAHNPAEAVLRFSLPLGAALLWWNDLTDEGVQKAKDTTTWRWTPRRLLLAVGAIEPGERDMVQVDRERRTAEMTAVVYRLDHGWASLRDRRANRLRRLALEADDEMLAEVRRRIARVRQVEQLTRPDATDDAVDDAMRARAADAVTQDVTQQNKAASDAPETAVTHTSGPQSDAVTRAASATVTQLRRPMRQPKTQPMTQPKSAGIGSDALTQAVERVLSGGASCRGAAREFGLSDATVTRAVRQARQSRDTQPRQIVTQPDAPRGDAVTQRQAVPATRFLDGVTQDVTQPAAVAVNGRVPQLTHSPPQ